MTPRNPPLAAASLCLCASFLLASCGPPAVSELGDIQEEDGIAQLTYSSDALSSFVLAEGQATEAFQLRDLAPATAFTRVGVRWDADTRGGMTSVQVRVVGGDQWMTVVVDSQELVPETGITLYAGHVDMPAGAQLETRFHLVRTNPSLPSPVLHAISIEAFDAATIAEAGEVGAGDGMESSSGSVEAPGGEAPAGPAAFVPVVTIVSRATWGASAARCEGNTHTPYRMTFHETVTPNGERGAAARARMRQMQSYHQNSRGYCDIGYHFAVDADGVVYQGRSTSGRAAAHTKNQNTGNIGVALMGTYDSVSAPESQLEGLMDIFAVMADTYDITVNADRVRGHQQWPGQSTSCPGAKVLARKSDILAGTVARMMGGNGGGGGGTSRPEIVVDNTSPDFVASPDWFLSTAIADPYGEDYRARSTALVSDPAYWSATLDGGSYEVFVWYTAATNRASAAPYFVYHQDGTTTLPVNQQLNGTRWVSLGTYAFTAGKNERVGLSCWTATGDFVIADAVKFVPR